MFISYSCFLNSMPKRSPIVVLIAIILVLILIVVLSLINWDNFTGQAASAGKDYVYVVTLNHNTGEIIKLYEYLQDKSITRELQTNKNQFLQYARENEAPPYTATLTVGTAAYIETFKPFREIISEEFLEDGTIKLDDISKEELKEVSVRFTLPQALKQGFTLAIKNDKNALLANKIYRSSVSNNRYFFEPADPGGKPGLKAKKVRMDLPSDEGSVNRQPSTPPVAQCPDLREIYPGHNNLGENRINIIFVGVGMNTDSNGKPEFVKYLTDFVDYSGAGIERYNYSFANEDLQLEWVSHGLIGEEPFTSNRHLFNLWYSNTALALDENDGASNFCFNFVKNHYNCDLSNPRVIYLLNRNCRSANAFMGSTEAYVQLGVSEWANELISSGQSTQTAEQKTFDYLRTTISRVVVHELGHSIGSLADEYEEAEGVDNPSYPNCLESSDFLIDYFKQRFRVQTFGGCSYTRDNVRFSENSVMRIQWGSGGSNDPDFEAVNQWYLCQKFSELTGMLTLGVCGRSPGFTTLYSCTADSQCASEICDYPDTRGSTFQIPKLCLRSQLGDYFGCDISRQCSSGLCYNVDGYKVCLPTHRMAGNECILDQQCQTPLRCRGQEGHKSCNPPLDTGISCSRNSDCQSNICFDFEPITTGVGERCISNNLQPGVSCYVHEQCASQQCILTAPGATTKVCAGVGLQPSSECRADHECASQLCRYPYSGQPYTLRCLDNNQPAGRPCDYDVQCQSPLICYPNPGSTARVCRDKLANGETCDYGLQCQSNICSTLGSYGRICIEVQR